MGWRDNAYIHARGDLSALVHAGAQADEVIIIWAAYVIVRNFGPG
jgi:uncharacterized membrane-anchored protein